MCVFKIRGWTIQTKFMMDKCSEGTIFTPINHLQMPTRDNNHDELQKGGQLIFSSSEKMTIYKQMM